MASLFNKIIFSSLLVLCSAYGFSQQKSMVFEQFDVEKGLSSNWVRDIAQDKQGYIWLATSDGLNRFDGYSFKTYQNDENDPKSLMTNYIRCIFVDSENILWVGYNDGLSRYDADKDGFAHFTSNPNNVSSLSSNKISDITCDSKGNLWIATRDAGICNLDKNTYKFHSYKSPDNPKVNSQYTLHCDRKDRLWIGAYEAGISLFDVPSKKYVPLAAEGNGLEGKFVTAIYEGNDGKIWVGTAKNGLYLYDEAARKFISNTIIPKDKMIVSICQDNDGNIWVSEENAGLYILDLKTNAIKNLRHNKFIQNSIGHNSINTIIKDMNGNIWLGTFASGVNLYKVPNNRFGHFFNDPLNPNSLSHNAVLAFAEDSEHNLWIGTDDGGLNKYNSTTNKFEFFNKKNTPSLLSDVIISVYEDKRKNIWVGTYLEGLHLFDVKKKTFSRKLPGYSFGSMLEDSEGNLWLGGWRDGLFLYDRDQNTFKNFQQLEKDPTSLSDNFVYYVYEDKRKNVWVCTSVGLNLIEDKEKGKFRHFMKDPGNPNSLANNAVYHCYEDSKGRFWIGTAGGLCQMHRDSIKFITYKEKDGLANNNVLGILEDNEGKLWLSTNKGISCFDPETKVFKNYNKSDGLQSNQFNVKAQYKLSTGELLFGGINGYNRFDPKDIHTNKNVPTVAIKDIQVSGNNKDAAKKMILSPVKDITLKSSQSNLTFDFVAFNYTNTQKVKYAYKLEGFDADWNYVDNPAPVHYTNLDPGTYFFKVKAANEDGIWNETGTQIAVTITPPFWASWWFRILVLAGITVAAIYIYRRNYSVVVRKQRILEDRVKEKTKQIIEHKEKIDALKLELNNKNTQW
ncbi:MAG TPA: two-component regulator propeller domain-containing protein [Cytophagaceae bacterium]|jgi:ligand-binding sensor domain-containing protein|nr:two-component regulator propeller domain-containing protein [Cytophagaceae bacterium]